jgi:UDP-glucose 4-epimerase
VLSVKKYFVTGGAGFIGAHLAKKLLSIGSRVTVFDNFSNGQKWHFEADVRDESSLNEAIKKHDVVFHLASNADIARAAFDPDIDFSNGTLLTRCVLEAMRNNDIKRIVFTSGSGVYGDVPADYIQEDYDKMIPVSTYGAQKLASESLIAAYSFMFDMHGIVFRFANVVGAHQTHGVAYDFLRRLAKNPSQLKILGDGTQSKPYVHIDDVLKAFLLIENEEKVGYEYFNVSSSDSLTVKEIADIACERMGLLNTRYDFTGGSRGWKADVPLYRLNTDKLRARGWVCKRNSREAVDSAIQSMIEDIKDGNITVSD